MFIILLVFLRVFKYFSRCNRSLLAVILKQSISEKKSIVGTLGYFGLIGNLLKIIGFTLIGFSFYEYIDTFLMIIPATLLEVE